jgi:hypothetical protein
MSQNSHSLLLFFDSADRSRKYARLLLALQHGETDTIRKGSEALDIDLGPAWHDDWFNQTVTVLPEGLRLDYDSSNHHLLPLRALQSLFARGLQAAVLQSFIDQAGELQRHHFLAGQWVSASALYQALPALQATVQAQLPLDAEQADPSQSPDQATDLQDLLDKEARHVAEVQEMLGAFKSARLAALADGGSGEKTLAAMKAALIIRAMAKGVLQAGAFMAVTLLLFKGKWLWIGLGVVLLIVLPLSYAVGVVKRFSNTEGSDQDAAN